MSLQKVSEAMVNEELEELKEIANDIKKIGVVNARTDLQTFEIYFLPYIIGEIEKNETNNAIFIDNYLSVTGNVTTPLDVYQGNELKYSLPPLLLSSSVEEKNNIDFRKIVSLYNSIKDVNPREANLAVKRLSAEVTKDIDLKSEDIEKYLISLRKIFEDYADRVKSGKLKELTKQDNKNKDEIEDDFFDY